MLRFGNTNVAKKKVGAKMSMQILDVDVEKIIISKLVKRKDNSKYLTVYLDDVLRPLVLISPKMNGYVKVFIEKCGDKNKNRKSMSLCIDKDKLLEIRKPFGK